MIRPLIGILDKFICETLFRAKQTGQNQSNEGQNSRELKEQKRRRGNPEGKPETEESPGPRVEPRGPEHKGIHDQDENREMD